MGIVATCDFCNSSDAKTYHLLQVQNMTHMDDEKRFCICDTCYQKMFQAIEHPHTPSNTEPKERPYINAYATQMTLRQLLCSKAYLNDTAHTYKIEDEQGQDIIDMVLWLDQPIQHIIERDRLVIVQLQKKS